MKWRCGLLAVPRSCSCRWCSAGCPCTSSAVEHRPAFGSSPHQPGWPSPRKLTLRAKRSVSFRSTGQQDTDTAALPLPCKHSLLTDFADNKIKSSLPVFLSPWYSFTNWHYSAIMTLCIIPAHQVLIFNLLSLTMMSKSSMFLDSITWVFVCGNSTLMCFWHKVKLIWLDNKTRWCILDIRSLRCFQIF